GREFPRGHEQRKIPGNNLACNTQRVQLAAWESIVELIGPTRVIEKVRRREGYIYIARFAYGFTAVDRLEHRELSRAVLNEACDAVDILRALFTRQLRPDLGVRRTRSLHRRIDVGLARLGDFGN